jgi:hypothetical protein
MTLQHKALRVDPQFAIATSFNNRSDTLGGFAFERATWSNNRDAHP